MLPGRSDETRQINSTFVNRFNVANWLELLISLMWPPKLLIDTGGDVMCWGKRMSFSRMSSKQPTKPIRTSSKVWCIEGTRRTSAPKKTSLLSKFMTSLTPGAAPCDRYTPSTTISAILPCRSSRTSCQIPSLTETSVTRTNPSPLPQSKRYCTWKLDDWSTWF